LQSFKNGIIIFGVIKIFLMPLAYYTRGPTQSKILLQTQTSLNISIIVCYFIEIISKKLQFYIFPEEEIKLPQQGRTQLES